MSSGVEWEALPVVVRRSFDAYLTDFQERSPDARLQRDGAPTQKGDDFAITFQDAASGARYEVPVSPDGTVGVTVRLA